MNKKHQFLLRLFILLFTVSVSVTIIPYSSIYIETLLDMVDDGSINEAEDKIYEIAVAGDKINLEMILLFYSYLNDKSDEFLTENNFSRQEVQDGLKYVLSQYGLDSMVELFLN